MKKPLLSICIPTYNRAEYLAKSVESVISQNEFLNGEVEIIISDNASTDDTEKVGRAYAAQYSNIQYHRNEINIRDCNFPLALSWGNGMYRRLCNDTLIFKKNSLQSCCRLIENNQKEKPFLVWANGCVEDKTEQIKTDFSGYVHKLSYWLTSIACFGLWEEDCQGIEDDTAGAELSLWQVRKELEVASRKDNVLICNERLTETQNVAKKNISYGIFKVFYENYFELLKPYFENERLSCKEKEFLEKDLLFRFLYFWCAQWELQNRTLEYNRSENLKEAIYNQYHGKQYWNEYEKFYRRSLLKMKAKNALKKLIKRGR